MADNTPERVLKDSEASVEGVKGLPRYRLAALTVGLLLATGGLAYFIAWSAGQPFGGPLGQGFERAVSWSRSWLEPLATALPFGFAFAAGMVSAVNPCGFAMLPAFIAFQLDDRAGEQPGAHLASRAARALMMGLVVTVGFVAMFAAAGAIIAAGGRGLIQVVPWAALVVGGAMVVLGLWSLSGRYLGILAASRIPMPGGRGWRALFLYGLAYGVASLSCTLPVFLVVVGSALAAQGIAAGIGQFILYALGMGLVLTVVSLAAALFKGAVARSLTRLIPYLERAGAALLVLAGLFLIYYWLTIGGLLGGS